MGKGQMSEQQRVTTSNTSQKGSANRINSTASRGSFQIKRPNLSSCSSAVVL